MDQNVGRVYFFLLNILLAQQYMVGVAITVAEAANVTSLKGTWASKSWAVFTGPVRISLVYAPMLNQVTLVMYEIGLLRPHQ